MLRTLVAQLQPSEVPWGFLVVVVVVVVFLGGLLLKGKGKGEEKGGQLIAFVVNQGHMYIHRQIYIYVHIYIYTYTYIYIYDIYDIYRDSHIHTCMDIYILDVNLYTTESFRGVFFPG